MIGSHHLFSFLIKKIDGVSQSYYSIWREKINHNLMKKKLKS